jgi:PAS domain S-box-containing protein
MSDSFKRPITLSTDTTTSSKKIKSQSQSVVVDSLDQLVEMWNIMFKEWGQPVFGVGPAPECVVCFTNDKAHSLMRRINGATDNNLLLGRELGKILPDFIESLQREDVLDGMNLKAMQFDGVEFRIESDVKKWRIPTIGVVKDKDSVGESKTDFLNSDSSVSFTICSTPVKDSFGNCLGIYITFSDERADDLESTRKDDFSADEAERERKRVQSELALVSMVAQKTDTGVVITDQSRRTIWVNKAFTKVTGYTLQEMYGKSPGKVLQCSQTDRNSVSKLHEELENGRGICIDILNRKKDGSLGIFNLDITPIFDDDGNLQHFVCLQREVSEAALDQMRLAAVEQAKAQAIANKLKTEFIMNMVRLFLF